MKNSPLFVLTILFAALTACAQAPHDCRPDGAYSLNDVRKAVRSVVMSHSYSGSEEKAFNRAGDLVSIAILQTLSDCEMASPQALQQVLFVIRTGFACDRCVAEASDREPRVALLLLDSLRNRTVGEARSDVDETRRFLLRRENTKE